ncbi:hypothetical protein BASA81_017100 [Batrachochytrium salamandrivorans]|nr:hypothetical protein BASA81_017100 [Batrachochytrium salamandrivorans]
MDDSVMQELNTNIADLINQNRAEMESKLKQNMRSCAFHESQYNGYDGKPICCGKPDACKRTKHCSKDHCKYKYAAFFERVSKIIGYSDTVNDMVSECIVDFENTDNNQSFRADIQESITDLSESRLIYKIYSSQDAFVSGEWLVDDNGKICGIVFSAKTTTIDEPIVQIVRFDIATFEQIGEVEHVTRGFVSYKPETPYTFPESISSRRVVPDIRVREARTDFKTKCTLGRLSSYISDLSLLALKPLRIRFTVEDIEGKQSLHCARSQGQVGVHHIGISGKSFDEDALNRLVYKAKKAGSTEVDLEIYRNFDERCLFNAWALVDLNCYRVYGFKMIMVPHELVIDKTAASMLYVACPDYGALTESRPIRYAEENVTLPTLGKIPEIDPTNDDTVDDIVVEIPTIVRSGISGGLSSDVTNGRVAQIDSVAIGQAVGVALSDRLVNLEDKLERTAASLESLVAIIKTLMMREGHSYQ